MFLYYNYKKGAVMSENNSLILKIDYIQNIELDDFILSLSGLNNEYSRFVEEKENNPLKQELKLYLKEVKKGSVIAEFFTAAAAGGTLAFMENAVTIITFTQFLCSTYGYFLGKNDKPKDFSKQELKNLKNIVEPIAKDNGSQLIIQNCDNVVFNINSNEANAIQNRIKREEEQQKIKDFRNVDFTLFKVRIPQDLTTGFSGIIKQVLPEKAVATVFQDVNSRDKIIGISENPLLKEFKIDAIVIYENDIPVKYQITNVY